jgi:hypothetical protein
MPIDRERAGAVNPAIEEVRTDADQASSGGLPADCDTL